ncbi:hypothetical protein AB0759_19875 [Scytonema tolypothrichoides VB-61278_2]|uniref:Uncharacterized protein n=2 Tax=Nostocales TaxID=1161 RepID=A0A8S9T3J2_9CYAN|nr:hypothetical protein [Tolypothrix bouteillei]KAF3886676.1 hypothetical protein DA73_0400015220 [Tolypothrix bouteillei VB521301]
MDLTFKLLLFQIYRQSYVSHIAIAMILQTSARCTVSCARSGNLVKTRVIGLLRV